MTAKPGVWVRERERESTERERTGERERARARFQSKGEIITQHIEGMTGIHITASRRVTLVVR